MENKICTSIEQSKKLIELGIDIHTADMCYRYRWHNNNFMLLPCIEPTKEPITGDIPAWSLAALLGVYPMVVGRDMDMYCCWQNSKNLHSRHYDNPVDACYEMILKLHEQKLL